MKKIAIVVPSLAIGGCERSVCNISYALKDKYEVYIVLFNGEDIHYNFNGTLIDLKLAAHPNPFVKIYNTIARVIKLKKLNKKYKFDYIYTFLGPTHLINYVSFGKTKKIMSCRGFSYLYDYKKEYCKMTEKSDAIIFNSQYMRDYFKDLYPKLRNKAFTVNNVFETAKIVDSGSAQTEVEFEKFLNSHKTIVATGRFCKEKGFDNLIKAFSFAKKKNENAGLVLVGGGELEDKLKKLAEDLEVTDSIYFTGYTDNPYKYMARCDIFTLSSRNEGFPNVLMEAMILGKPAISLNCKTGPSEIIFKNFDYDLKVNERIFGDYGVILPAIENEEDYNPNNVDELHKIYGRALNELLDSEELIAKYKELSKIRSLEYTKEKIADEFENIFERIGEIP